MFGLRMRFLLGAAIAIVALATASAQAARPFELGAQTLYNADGSGKLFAVGSSTTWERCNPDLSVCEAASTTREISTQGAPDGTVFKLQGNATGAIWHGNLSIVAPPSVQGVLSANELVTPVPAGWQEDGTAASTRPSSRCAKPQPAKAARRSATASTSEAAKAAAPSSTCP